MLRVLATVLTLALVASCAPVPGEGGVEAVIPILANDPDNLVETMAWGDSPAIPFPPTEMTVLEVMDASNSEVLRIAVDGGQCPPTAQVQVAGSPESVRIELVLGGPIEPEGQSCGEILTTHELIITFNQPIELNRLTISARRTARS